MEARRAARLQLGPAAGQIAGFAFVAAINAAVVSFREPGTQLKTRALLHVFDAAELLALGVLCAALVVLWQRMRLPDRPPAAGARWGLTAVAIWIPALALGAWMLAPDLSGPAGRMSVVPSGVGRAVLVALSALGIPLAALFGRLLARGWLRTVPVLLGATLAAANHFVLSHGYPGIHFFAAWAAAISVGAALTTWEGSTAPGWCHVGVGVVLALASLWSLFLQPPNAVRLRLYQHPGCAVAPWLARLERRIRIETRGPLSPEAERWYGPRQAEPDILPAPPPGIPKNPIVLLLVVDAMRAELLTPRFEPELPTFTRLKKRGVELTQARAAAPGTTWSITSLLTSRYPCQIAWADQRGRPFPHEDPSVRFPELLAARGVQTLNLQGLSGLGMKHGIARGFTEETIVPSVGRRFASSVEMVPVLVERLGRAGDAPLFAYLHFDDAHAPYDRVTTEGAPFERYVAEVKQVDTQLGALLEHLERSGLAKRTLIILTADHGEAFAEHGKSYHASTLYSEMIHVPLVLHGPGLEPRRIAELVSLVDIAPTVLDFFGLPTPGSFMGQSLSPLLAGEKRELVRPVVAESDNDTHAMFFRDGFKVILDRRGGTLELYDLARDPNELENLSDTLAPTAKARAGLLESFLAAQRPDAPKAP